MKKQFSRRSLLGNTAALGVSGFATSGSAGEDTAGSSSLVDICGRSDAKPNWLMPAHFGPINWEGARPVDGNEGESQYRDVTVISLRYLTDEASLSRYLPERFELNGPPLLSVSYSQNREISWLAGGQYNIISVTAPVKFNGDKDVLTGAYALVLWENLTEPILVGREALEPIR